MSANSSLLLLLSASLAFMNAHASGSDISIGCDEACLVEKALLGDKAAAATLASDYIKRPKIGEYWALIAAQNGSVVHQYNIGVRYIEHPSNKYEKMRGFFWMCSAARSGDAGAKKFLRQKKYRCAP